MPGKYWPNCKQKYNKNSTVHINSAGLKFICLFQARIVDGGDGGNRTRVRKIRPADIYELSRLFCSPAGLQATKTAAG